MRRWIVFGLLVGSVEGLIFRDGVSPVANTETAPTGDFAGSGWQHQVYYLNYHGTVISPKHVITARHLGSSATVLTKPVFFGGTEGETYTIKGERILIGETDFSIFEIWETFPDHAPLYEGTDEVGREMVIHGSGVDRGAAVASAGWRWGGGTRKSRWGRNVIKGTTEFGTDDYLYFSFDDVLGQDEVMATGGDSGGGWFIEEGGVWKLAGVSYGVDALYSDHPVPANANGFRGAFYDASGLSYGTDADGWEVIPASGVSHDPNEIEFYRQSHTYGSRISSRLAEIEAIIAPALAWEALDAAGKFGSWLDERGVTVETGLADDPDEDGLSNLEEYFGESHPGDSDEAAKAMRFVVLPDGTHELTLRESLDLAGRDLSSVVEYSVDLSQWDPVPDLVEQSNVRDNHAGIRTRVMHRTPVGPAPLFYRVSISLGPTGS